MQLFSPEIDSRDICQGMKPGMVEWWLREWGGDVYIETQEISARCICISLQRLYYIKTCVYTFISLDTRREISSIMDTFGGRYLPMGHFAMFPRPTRRLLAAGSYCLLGGTWRCPSSSLQELEVMNINFCGGKWFKIFACIFLPQVHSSIYLKRDVSKTIHFVFLTSLGMGWELPKLIKKSSNITFSYTSSCAKTYPFQPWYALKMAVSPLKKWWFPVLHPEADRTKEVNPRGKYVLRLYDGAKEGDVWSTWEFGGGFGGP